MNIYKRIVNELLRPHARLFVLAIGCMIVSSCFESISLSAIIPLIDIILAGKEIYLPADVNVPVWIASFVEYLNTLPRMAILHYLISAIPIIFVLKEVFIFMQSFFMSKVGLRIVRDVNQRLYDHLMGLSLDFFLKTPTGKLMSRITNDTVYLRTAAAEGLLELLYQPIKIVIYVFMLLSIRSYFGISWTLVFVSFVLIPIVVYPIIRIGQRVKKLSHAWQEAVSNLNICLHETITGIRVVKGFSMEPYEKKRFKKFNQDVYAATLKSIVRLLAVSPLTELVGVGCMGLVLWLGAGRVIDGTLSPGAFVAFLAASLSLVKPFKRLGKVHGVNQRGVAGAERVFEILDEVPTVAETPGAAELPVIQEKIEFKDIMFKYSDDIVLDHFSLVAPKGKITAIVGPSGGGKSTLVSFVPRFYDPSEGQVLIDGVDICTVKVTSLRKHIGIVTQETILFHDTVRANIAYGSADISQDKVEHAAHIANAHEFIMKMPDGYDTIIGERGFRLSGGERQRLAIARAILKDPPILILDEATSQLDTISESLVQQAIERLMAGRTTLVIAHRLSTIKRADQIVVIEQGKISQLGTHEELIAKEGPYKNLYSLQIAQAH